MLRGWSSLERQLVFELSRLTPAQPRIFAIASGPELAFPLTRKLHGTSVGRAPFQWVSDGAERLLASGALDAATRPQIETAARLDRFEVAQAIRDGRPDVILVEGAARERWALSHAEIAAALSAYRKVKTISDVQIWLPRQPTAAKAP